MSKKTKSSQNRTTTNNIASTATSAISTRQEPNQRQLERLDTAESQIEALNTEHGQQPIEAIDEKVGPTLEESLKRVEDLLKKAHAHFDAASKRKDEAEREVLRQATLAHSQDVELRQKKRDADADIASQKREVEQDKLELQKRIEEIHTREETLNERVSTCQATEATFAEKGARLTARELNAERGFLTEKAQILGPIEDEVRLLREERDLLDDEITKRREAAEEEIRAKANVRAQRWAQEDAARTTAEAEARRNLDAEIICTRQEQLAALRALLASERENAETTLQTELDRRIVAFNERERQLDDRETILNERLRAHRAAMLDLQAAQEILVEDRDGLSRRVERLVAEQTENLRHQATSLQIQLTDARTQRDAYFRELESRRELDRRFGDRTPEDILSALVAAESERDSLTQQLRERPDASDAERLSELEQERSKWLEQRAALCGDLANATGELASKRLEAIKLETLQRQKEALEVHKQLLDGAVDELRVRVDELTRQEDHRNPMMSLTSLDEQEELQTEVRTTAPLSRATPTLKEFAEGLRHRIATGVEGRTLYYTERDVRAFLGGLAMTKLMLLQGISGTGKTSLPLAFANAVGGGIEIVEVQAGWRDRQDLVGYYNAFHRHYYATNFLQALYRAGTPAYRDRIFLMVLDEMNLSRPEQFFADFLSALEQPAETRRITLVNDPVTNAPKLMRDGRHLPIPPNIWFVGTANHDESTAEFADKTYDRAHVMEMPRNTGAAQFEVQERPDRQPLSYHALEEAFTKASTDHAQAVRHATDWLRGASFTHNLQQRFRVGWGNRLENQISRYLPVIVASGGSIGEAMDHLLVTKVLRKLKDRHDVRADALEDLSFKLQEAWEQLDGQDAPERCISLVDGEITAKNGEDL
jgi:hypothetical protein